MQFYNGSIQYETLEAMSYPKIFNLKEQAIKLNKAAEKQVNNTSNWKKL